MIAVVTLQKYI